MQVCNWLYYRSLIKIDNRSTRINEKTIYVNLRQKKVRKHHHRINSTFRNSNLIEVLLCDSDQHILLTFFFDTCEYECIYMHLLLSLSRLENAIKRMRRKKRRHFLCTIKTTTMATRENGIYFFFQINRLHSCLFLLLFLSSVFFFVCIYSILQSTPSQQRLFIWQTKSVFFCGL